MKMNIRRMNVQHPSPRVPFVMGGEEFLVILQFGLLE